jgi:hypothetical protein
MPYLFGYQQGYTSKKKEPGRQAAVMMAEPMP